MLSVAVAGYEKNLKNYRAALAAAGMEPVITLAADEAVRCDGLLLPGGGDIDPPLYGAEDDGSQEIDRPLDLAQLCLTELFVRAGKPVLGICKGHQVINVFFGGTIIQDLATAEAHQYHERDSVHGCVSLPGSLMETLYGRRYRVNSAHHQGLGRIGDGLRVTSFAEDGAVESVEHESLPVLGLQWHPERMCFGLARPDTVDGAPVFTRFRAAMERVRGG